MARLTIFVVTFALLIDEIMLSAIFQVLLGAGNTVAAIAIALIGLSASGVVAYSVPALNTPSRSARIYPKLLFAFGVSLMLSPLLLMRIPINHADLAAPGSGLAVHLWHFAIYHLAVIPFFLGGLTISVLLRAFATDVSRLYAFDLAGAAVGCLASPTLLSLLGAPAAIVASALPGTALAAWLGLRSRVLSRWLLLLPAGVLAALLLRPDLQSFATLNTMGDVRAPTYLTFPVQADDIEFEKWAVDAWTIIRSEDIPQQWERFEGWGLSSRYEGAVPRIRLVNYNARFSTYVTEYDGDTRPLGEWLDADLTTLHYRLGRSFDRVLNIGAGGGREVLAALHHGAGEVVAVDVSEVVVEDIMKDYLREFSGELYLDPRVTAIADEGRTFAERSRERFDLIDFSIVGGANMEKMELVRVDDLFTLEALRTYLDRLEPDGVFSYVMYSTRSDLLAAMARGGASGSQPYIPALRTLTGLRRAFEERRPGARFADHVLIAALSGVIDPRYDLLHIVVSKERFSAEERSVFARLCRELEFQSIHPPLGDGPGDPSVYTRAIEEPDLAGYMRSLPFGIGPTTDDRPFQYTLDVRHLRRALADGAGAAVLTSNPLISLGTSLGGVALAVTLVPLFVIGVRRGDGFAAVRRSGFLLPYFACLGFGYMAVEIPTLLRLQSYLGKPIYGLSVGLFAFLLASGIGSHLTGSLNGPRLGRAAYAAVAAVCALGAGFLWVSGPLFASTIVQPLPVRIAVATAAIFPLALPMGMLFPIGVKLIAPQSRELIPWVWAVNGCLSVLGIFGTRILALFIGFSDALLVGLFVYALAALAVLGHTRASGPPGATAGAA